MAIYNDIVHGVQWELNALEADLKEHSAMRQLERKTQLGLTYRVFTNAVHTRYVHSMGVAFAARRFAEAHDFSPKDTALLQAAGALHDIGHFPFSHAVEEALDIDHEDISQIVLRGKNFGAINGSSLCDLLEKHKISPDEVARVLAGKHRLSPLISNPVIDIDRMDYLPRDLKICQVDYGSNTDRLYRKLTFDVGLLGIKDDGIVNLRAFCVARANAFDSIYYHPVKHAGEAMFKDAIRADPAFKRGNEDLEFASKIHAMSEPELMERLIRSRSPRSRELATLVQGDINCWYPTIVTLGGKKYIGELRSLYINREALLSELSESGFIAEFTGMKGHVKEEKPLPVFPVSDGSSLWDDSIARAAATHVPRRVFSVYDADFSRKNVAEEIVAKYSNS